MIIDLLGNSMEIVDITAMVIEINKVSSAGMLPFNPTLAQLCLKSGFNRCNILAKTKR